MSHPVEHAKSSVRKWGGSVEDYLPIHEWFDETKAWYGHSLHRMFRHHSEGIFECERVFGKYIINSVGKRIYTRYVGEQHVKEDCYNYIPSAKEWILNMNNPTEWMLRTIKIEKENDKDQTDTN